MAEELKGLIEKIREEGVRAAEEKAAAIIAEAEKRAAGIVAGARDEAERILSEAGAAVRRMEEGAKSSLKQASRDTVLSLKKEIAAILDRIIGGHVTRALTRDECAKMILGLVKGCGAGRADTIIISLRKEDAGHIEKALLAELGAEVKKGVTLLPADDLRAGFRISFDGGKSCYDFSDRAVAEYLAARLKPQLGDLLKEAIPEGA